MVSTPVWQAPTAGQSPKAAQANQFLGTHALTCQYAGTATASVLTSGASHSTTNATWLAQQFTTAAGQTAIGHVQLPLSATTSSGASLSPTMLSLYANVSGVPSGSPLVSTTVTTEYANLSTGGVDTALVSFPLPITGLSPSTVYWLVVSASGNAGNNFTWRRSAATSTAATSSNGTAWTAAAFGLQYIVFDQSVTGLLTTTYEDGGSRWTTYTYNAGNNPTSIAEFTAGQTTDGYVQSYRTIFYSGVAMIGVS